jgi:1-aminocyclopropane-1-carboxylate deaminase
MFSFQDPEPIITELSSPLIKRSGLKVFILREELSDPLISGNKWWKLKYNLIKAMDEGHDCVLTFGGAYSNHIAATAAAGKKFGIKTIGVIRGEKILPLNPTLSQAQADGMNLHFVSREKYRQKNNELLTELKNLFGKFYLIPEGGANDEGVKGCAEILKRIDFKYDVVCCACGTGTTIAGIILSMPSETLGLGFSALKGGSFLKDDINKKIAPFHVPVKEWDIILEYHFGGFAKTNKELLHFKKKFETEFNVPLDYIYTAKMMFGIFDMINKDYFRKGSKILAIHTGGLQGNAGIEASI